MLGRLLDKSFVFEIFGERFNSGDKISICENSGPFEIELFKKDGTPIVSGDNLQITWTEATTLNQPLSSIASVTPDGSRFTVKVDVMDASGERRLELKFRPDAKVNFLRHIRTPDNEYEWDDNTGGYSTYDYQGDKDAKGDPISFTPKDVNWFFFPGEGIPSWNFQIKANSDKNIIEIKHKGNVNIIPKFLTNSKITELNDVSATSNAPFVDRIYGCDDKKDLARVFIAPQKVEKIRIYRLCESDDDVKLYDGDPPQIPTGGKCIGPGQDGVIDERYSPEPIWLKGGDRILNDFSLPVTHEDYGKAFVYPNSDGYCNSLPLNYNESSEVRLKCPDIENYDVVGDINDFFKKINVRFEAVNQEIIDLNYSFDTIKDDNKIDKTEMLRINLDDIFNALGEPVNSNSQNEFIFFIVEEYGEGVSDEAGGARIPDSRIFTVLNESFGGDNGIRTVAHEIGHSFDLDHPEDIGINDDSESFMFRWTKNEDQSENSGESIRAHDWILIHNE